MATRRKADRPRPARATPAAAVLGSDEVTLLDVLDEVLNKGVVLNGDLVLGVAGVDLVYVNLSSLLCAVDRVAPGRHGSHTRRHNPGPRALRKP